MAGRDWHVVTGGLGYSGRYIVRRLLGAGRRVATLTNSGHLPNPFGERLEVRPLPFHDPTELARALTGAEVLYNTYWVRFNHRTFGHATAVEHSLRLFAAAREAGVRRVVHVSITNPSPDSPLEYFRGKALLEEALQRSGMEWAILRPAVLFGLEDILINNIIWLLRHFPLFGVFGDGGYRLQPIFVDDLAALAVEAGASQEQHCLIQAIGPETFTYRELVATLGRLVGCPRPIVSIPPWLGYQVARLVGVWVRDVVLTREEITGLMADLLQVDASPTGTTRLTEWVTEHAHRLGRSYASELRRRIR